MHIPEHMLNGAVCPVTAVASATGIAGVSLWAAKVKERPKTLLFGAVTAFVFAGQMINFPVQNGTSGHLLGVALAVSLLGIPFGILSMALVVLIQSLLFSDGGISVLGANILNMAFVGALPIVAILYMLKENSAASLKNRTWLVALASWLSVILAAFAVVVQLHVDGVIAMSQALPAMLGVHAIIGLGEVAITLLVLYGLKVPSLESSQKISYKPLAFAALLIALLLSPFASGFPDGLEWVAERYSFLHESAPAFVAPLADYAVPFISHEGLSTAMAGIIGTAFSFVAAWLIAQVFAFKTS